MSYADAPMPRAHVDAKRIAATSGVIALHAAIFMLLLMPATRPDAPAKADSEMVVTIPERKIEVIPPPMKQEIKPVVKDPPRTVVPIREEVMAPPTDEPGPLDTPYEEVKEPPNSFEIDPPQAATQFAQLGVAVGPAPPYPKPAQLRNIQGTVVLRIHVDAAGKPIEVQIEQSSGSRILDEAASQFVMKRWLFVPAQQDGHAVESWGLLPVDFRLH